MTAILEQPLLQSKALDEFKTACPAFGTNKSSCNGKALHAIRALFVARTIALLLLSFFLFSFLQRSMRHAMPKELMAHLASLLPLAR